MKTDKILLDHGSGGKISHGLTMELILPIFGNDILDPLEGAENLLSMALVDDPPLVITEAALREGVSVCEEAIGEAIQ
mgnify:CR=1 FL=1